MVEMKECLEKRLVDSNSELEEMKKKSEEMNTELSQIEKLKESELYLKKYLVLFKEKYDAKVIIIIIFRSHIL